MDRNGRRNLFVLALVIALLVASACVIIAKRDQARASTCAAAPSSSTRGADAAEARGSTARTSTARSRSSASASTRSASPSPRSRASAPDQIEVGLPDVQDADRAIEQVGDHGAALLLRLRAERDPAGPRRPGPPTQRLYNRLYDAVEVAVRARAGVLPQRPCTTTGRRYYLFDSEHARSRSPGRRSEKQDLFLPLRRRAARRTRKVIDGAAGDDRRARGEADDDPRPRTSTRPRRALAVTSSSATARRSPATTSRNPEQSFDPTPTSRTSPSTSPTRAAGVPGGHRRDRRARRRHSAAARRPPTATAAAVLRQLRDRPRRRDRLAADHQLRREPGRDRRPHRRPDLRGFGRSRRPRTWPSSCRSARCRSSSTLISQSTVSATLGEQALDQGLKAGLVGPDPRPHLPDRLLPLPRRRRRRSGCCVYAIFFFALIKLIPITLTLPGIAGLILTIGVAADSNIVIFERIKEEVQRGSLDALGDRRPATSKGIATIIDANVITLITAFILFVLATRRGQGLRVHARASARSSRCSPPSSSPRRCSGLLGRARLLRSPSVARRRRASGSAGSFDFIGASRWFFSISGVILRDRRDRLRDQAAQLRHRLRVGHPDHSRRSPSRPASRRSATRSVDAGIEGADSAKIQETERPGLRRQRGPDPGRHLARADRPRCQRRPRARTFGLEAGEDGFDSTSDRPDLRRADRAQRDRSRSSSRCS